MMQCHIKSMRRAANKIMKRPRPPLSVMIRTDHAAYLGITPLPRNPYKGPDREPDPDAVPTHYSLCKVLTSDLYLALKDAKGIDEEIKNSGTDIIT